MSKSSENKRTKHYNPTRNRAFRALDREALSLPAARELTPAMRAFADQYLLCLDPLEAASFAGYADPAYGHTLLKHVEITRYLRGAMNRRASRVEVSQDHVLRRWVQMLQVSPNEYAQLRVGCCRNCWGMDHRHQYTDPELAEESARHRAEQDRLARISDHHERVPFDDQGGGGFNKNLAPMRGPDDGWAAPEINADHSCPACGGDGEARMVLQDTRHLSPAALSLLQGVERGAHGQLKINTISKAVIEDWVARHVGMWPREGRVPPKRVDEMTDDELNDLLSANGVTVDVDEVDALDAEAGREAGPGPAAEAEAGSPPGDPPAGVGTLP